MKKKLVAVLATVAAVFGFGFASNAALADYGTVGNVDGSSVSVTLDGFASEESVAVTSDKGDKIETVAATTVKATKDGKVSVKVSGVACATEVTVSGKGATSGHEASVTTKTAACAEPSSATKTTANTGAAVAPYAVAVALLAAAGVAVFAVRKTNAR